MSWLFLATSVTALAFAQPEKSAAPPPKSPKAQLPPKPPKEDERQSQVVASFEGGKITVGDVELYLSRSSDPAAISAFSSPQGRAELLSAMIRSALLAEEANKRGLATGPEVINSIERSAIQEMIREDFEAKYPPESITKDEIKKYYGEHITEFVRPELRRASHILAAAREEAEDLIKKLNKGDMKAFRKAARDRSIDQSTKMRGGDLGYFDKQGVAPNPRKGQPVKERPPVDEALAKAAFSLVKIGDVSPKPVKVADGFSVVVLTGFRPASSLNPKEADELIRKRLAGAKKEQAVREHIAQLRQETKPVYSHLDLIEAIRLEAGLPKGSQPEKGGPHGAAKTRDKNNKKEKGRSK